MIDCNNLISSMNHKCPPMKKTSIQPASTSNMGPLPKRIVSAKRGSGPSAAIALRLPADTAAKLTTRAQSLHVSRNDLIIQAVTRCLRDDIWRATKRGPVASNVGINPPPELVAMSNNLVAFAFVLKELLDRNTQKRRGEANRILLDATEQLNSLRKLFGC